MAGVLIHGDTQRSPEMRHELPLSVGDPFLYLEIDGRREVLVGKIETRYGVSHEEAERQVGGFESKHK